MMLGLPLAAWVFGSLASLLILLALLFLFWPLISRRAGNASTLSRKQTNILLYRERVAELERAVAAGELSEADAGHQQEEAGRHLLEDTGTESLVHPDVREGGRWLVLLAAVFLPVFAVFIYLQGDGWRLLEADTQSPPWDFIIQRAEARLENNPEDIDTWIFLARSYRALERYEEAASTYERLNAINPAPNPELLVEQGEMIALTKGGDMSGQPTELFAQALQINPEHGGALWYNGLAALQRKDEAEAVKHWQALAGQKLPESFRLVLERQLRKLGAEVPEGPAQAQPALPAVIKLRVEADSALVDELPPETAVFVFARAENGPPQPLAAQRLTLSQLPADVALTDAMQMAGGPALSSFERWTLYARVSLGGTAKATQGDPFGTLEIGKSDALKGRTLKIDQIWSQ